ncbi:MAG TPA: hypothetical protein VEK76_09170 [Candidatus Binatia bacterium]|nr:hypothetical protein [Candidatus Binatia bacterium]
MAAAVLAALGPGATALAASPPWWQLAAFPGQTVSRVVLVDGRVVAVVSGEAMAQTPGGFVRTSPPPPPRSSVTAGTATWSIDPSGRVMVSRGDAAATPDPGAPGLGAGADLIAAPLASPGTVIAVSTAGVVWCRSPDGGWSVSLVLLPDTLVTGTPGITSIAGFNQSRQTEVVYIGTAGYGTLLTSDGGQDWTRADPGLPSHVLSLVADPAGNGAVWAGTARGLYVHRLRPLPSIPAYSAGSLSGRWLLTGVICAAVVLLAAASLVAWSRRTGGAAAPAS